MKVILNKCYGGFMLSNKAQFEYYRRKGTPAFAYDRVTDWQTQETTFVRVHDANQTVEGSSACGLLWFGVDMGERFPSDHGFIPKSVPTESVLCMDTDAIRVDPIAIAIVEEMGEEASGWASELRVVEIPDWMDWVIDDYDGIETLHEDVPTW